MKLFIATAVLKKALKTGKIFASPKAPKPILRNVLLRAEAGDRVTVASTDSEKTAKAFTTCAQVLEPGAALLPAEAVKTLEKVKSEYVTMDVTKNSVTIEAGAFKTTFYTEDTEDYPALETETAPLFKTTGKDLARLARVSGFTEQENGRYALGGILLDMQEAGKIYTVATDGRRMGVQEIAAETAKDAPQSFLILSRAPFLKAVKALEKAGNISVSIAEKGLLTVVFSSEEMEISTPCLEGRFPDWRLGINQLVNPSISSVNRDALLSLETFSESVTDGTNPGIVFERKDEKTLDIWGVLGLNEGSTTAPAQVAPDFPKIKLNWYFLRDFLKVAPVGEMTVKTKDSRSGVLFETTDNFRYLVMPMHLDRKRPESTQAAEEKPETTPAKKTAKKAPKKAPTLDASTPAAVDTAPAGKAPEKQEEKPLQADQEKQGEKQEEKAPENLTAAVEKPEQEKEPAKEETQRPSLPPCRAFVFSSKDVSSRPGEVLATVKKALASDYKTEQPSKEEKQAAEPSRNGASLEIDPVFQAMKRAMESAKNTEPAEPAERPSVRASEPAPVESAPLPSEPSRAAEPSGAEPSSRAEKAFEIGTYTTKKGKVKTAVKFNVTPRTEWIEALKKAYFWEYGGRWCGSPRKLPEIFKH